MTQIRAVVVDDNRLNREMVAKTLEGRGIQTVQAEDASKGLKLIQLVSPHLAVLDVMMPGVMDGIQLCSAIRQDPRFSDMVIIMVTAAEKRREAERAQAAGADILISKPFSPKDFWSQVDSLLKTKSRQPKEYKIMVLDDEQDACELAEKILKKAGYQVMSQTEARGILTSIKSFNPHLVLLDVMMPDLSGNDIAQIIGGDKSLSIKPKILFYSNKTEQELRVIAERTQVDGYVCKVDGSAALLKKVKEVLTFS